MRPVPGPVCPDLEGPVPRGFLAFVLSRPGRRLRIYFYTVARVPLTSLCGVLMRCALRLFSFGLVSVFFLSFSGLPLFAFAHPRVSVPRLFCSSFVICFFFSSFRFLVGALLRKYHPSFEVFVY